MLDSIKDAVLKTVICIAVSLILGSTYSAPAQTNKRTSHIATEKWIIAKVAKGEEAHLEEAFPNQDDRKVSGSFMQKLLTNSIPGLKVSRRGVHIYDAVISDVIDLRNEEIPFTFSLSNCVFDADVVFRSAHIRGDINTDKSSFKQPVSFEDVDLEGTGFFRETSFEDQVTFEGAHVSRHLIFEKAQFNNTAREIDFENAHVEMNAFFNNAMFRGPVDFRSAYIDKNAFFDGATFDGPVTFHIAEIKKDLMANAAQFKHPEVDANFFGLKVEGNAIFTNSVFDGGLTLTKADVGGNVELDGVRAPNEKRGKSLAGLKADTLIFDGAQFAPPYYLNGMSYRLISYNMDDDALLAFVGKANYRSDVYSTLESYYQRVGDVYAARDVHVAGKDRERDIAFSKFPLRSAWMWVQYATMGYGKFLVRALLWSLVFIIVGCVLFWREEGIETQDANDAEKYKGRYHPIWYSLATFLPIVNLPDASIWTPKVDRKVARFYLRLHIIFGYLLIPIGLAAWTGIIK